MYETIYTALIDPPMNIIVSDLSSYSMVVKLSLHDVVEAVSWNLDLSLVSATFLPTQEDYCTGKEECASDMRSYLSEANAYKNKCVLKNLFDFVGKYSYCEGT